MIEQETPRQLVELNRIALRVSWEQMAMHDARYLRKVSRRIETPPTAEEWAEYRRARYLLEALRESPYFDEGGPEEGATVTPPEPRIEYEYAENMDAWAERCAKLSKHTGESFFRQPWQ